MKRWLRKVLNMHSPSNAMRGTCRCKRCREYKPIPTEATLRLAPGVTTLNLVGYDNEPISTVVLTRLTQSGRGLYFAEFEDKVNYIRERTIQRTHSPGCQKGWHTVAEGCGP